MFDSLGIECAECLSAGRFVVGIAETEAQARALVAECEQHGGWELQRALALFGLTAIEASLPRGERALYVPDSRLIVVQRALKAPLRTMALWHECAHAVSPARATHADVHALSLALAIPPQRLDAVIRAGLPLTAQEIHDRALPVWAAVLRCRFRKSLDCTYSRW